MILNIYRQVTSIHDLLVKGEGGQVKKPSPFYLLKDGNNGV